MRVGSITTEQKCDGIIENAICPNCSNTTRVPMIRIIQTGRIVFIPFIKKTVCYYTKCPCCGMEYILPGKLYESVLQTSNSELLSRECNTLLQISKNKELQYEQKSNKNWGISLLLAIVGGIFGLQHWYMGFKNRGLIAIYLWLIGILSFVVSISLELEFTIFIAALCIAVNVYWGLFDAIRILIGKAKDGDNKYIMTTGQHQRHLINLKQFR